jgi:hypothetical protein
MNCLPSTSVLWEEGKHVCLGSSFYKRCARCQAAHLVSICMISMCLMEGYRDAGVLATIGNPSAGGDISNREPALPQVAYVDVLE